MMKRPASDRGYEKVAHLYDLFDQKENIAFFSQYASCVEEILDIGAGTGRIAIPIAEQGVAVTCVEPSPAMRRVFQQKLTQFPHIRDRITLIADDAHSFDAERTFPVAFLSGTFDHLLDDDERRTSLINIGRHLIPHGVIVFDIFLGLMKDTPLSPAGIVQNGEREFRRFTASRSLPGEMQETQLVFETYHHGRLTERVEDRGLVGVTDRARVHSLLRETGFVVKAEFGDYQRTEFHDGDSLLIMEAEWLGGASGRHPLGGGSWSVSND
ncbi:MAG TPA: class I SAM-dependent methyltransferase [Anaerolineae bacterium]|nr:class I SAM-dependent methyltransferase [Anaerolineae bacterium]